MLEGLNRKIQLGAFEVQRQRLPSTEHLVLKVGQESLRDVLGLVLVLDASLLAEHISVDRDTTQSHFTVGDKRLNVKNLVQGERSTLTLLRVHCNFVSSQSSVGPDGKKTRESEKAKYGCLNIIVDLRGHKHQVSTTNGYIQRRVCRRNFCTTLKLLESGGTDIHPVIHKKR